MDGAAVDALAERLLRKMEHLDPSPEEQEWEKLSEYERDFYRICVREIAESLLEALKPFAAFADEIDAQPAVVRTVLYDNCVRARSAIAATRSET